MDDPRVELLIRYGGAFADESWSARAGLGSRRRAAAGYSTSRPARSARPSATTTRAWWRRSSGSLESVIHLNSWMLSPPVLDLADALLATLPPPLERAMFLSTGGESVEVAVRMAKLGTGRFEVASLTRSWHGLTGGAAA